MTVLRENYQGKEQEEGELFKVNASAVSGGQNELTLEFKMTAGDINSLEGRS